METGGSEQTEELDDAGRRAEVRVRQALMDRVLDDALSRHAEALRRLGEGDDERPACPRTFVATGPVQARWADELHIDADRFFGDLDAVVDPDVVSE
ncbi:MULTISPECIES: hypothetical protein [unclassified Pseudofrankia]|uniref:hypothetical protein n=1 Tax=unclassified Pseudofrankia TaxID=2994372 RepID=UPI0008D97FAF|nr:MULTISPECIES: hypothetical protein [unclassified Pseudofrankia]MDT3446485.1 hypothetical protein [Pseudofrankia sp. BMG5.37]OHV45165.1 hypothetical protein BCD48_23690 [Pseudofrankia sp. BMG5.36]